MTCPNCGFQNAAGDQFCGSCGKFLEWSSEAGEAAEGTQPAADGPAAPGEPPPPTASEELPTTVTPSAGASGRAGVDPPQPVPPPTVVSSLDAGIVCWNCGRQNPASRSFCQQCGEKLNVGTGAPAAGGQAATPTSPEPGIGDGRRRLLAIGAGALAVLLLAGGAAAVLFGGGGGGATPGASGTAVAVSLSPGVTEIPTSGDSPSPSTSPSAGLTASPTASPTTAHQATATPKKAATPTHPPTPKPTPAHCDDSVAPTHQKMFTAEDPEHQINPQRGWCIHQLIFIAEEGDGRLKLFLTNKGFKKLGYSSNTIGWHEAHMPFDFQGGAGSGEYLPDLDVIQPYRLLPAETTIRLDIQCDTETCSGKVQLIYERISTP
jgi:hypothetical protein